MSESADRKMFSPMWRGDAVSPEAKIVGVLKLYQAGATVSDLALELGRTGLVVGSRASVAKRVAEMLEALERSDTIERVPDGRYRVVPSAQRPGP